MVLGWPAYVYRAVATHIRDYPPMQTAGPRAVAEGFATVMGAVTTGKDPVPFWAAAPSLYTLPVDEEERRRKQRKAEEEADELASL